jgi:cyclic-di-GMP phosphodiesterase, flagellum assembly factor TipF
MRWTARRRLIMARWGWIGLVALLSFMAVAVIAFMDQMVWMPALAGWPLYIFSALNAIIAVLALIKARMMRFEAEKASHDLDAVSSRLLHLEARLADFDRQAGSGLRHTIAEVTGEIGLLGGLVKDLAVAVASHDRDLVSLRDTMETSTAKQAAKSVDSPKTFPVQRTFEDIPPPQKTDRLRPAPPAAIAPPIEAVAAPSVIAPAEPLTTMPNRKVADILLAFKNDAIDLCLQPVVSLPQRKVRFYEVLARLRLPDGTLLMPAEFMPTIEAEGIAPAFDRKVILQALAIARHLAIRGGSARISCNISPVSLQDHTFLKQVLRLLESQPDLFDKIILEIAQRSWRQLDAEAAGYVQQLRDKGMAFALDRAVDIRIDAFSLAERGVKFVKLPGSLLLAAEKGGRTDVATADLAAIMARAGIALIAEKVESEAQVPDLIEFNIPLAQGFVFAPPRLVRADVLNPTEASAVAPQPSKVFEDVAPSSNAAVSAPTEQRLPLRAFLRRVS